MPAVTDARIAKVRSIAASGAVAQRLTVDGDLDPQTSLGLLPRLIIIRARGGPSPADQLQVPGRVEKTVHEGFVRFQYIPETLGSRKISLYISDLQAKT